MQTEPRSIRIFPNAYDLYSKEVITRAQQLVGAGSTSSEAARP